MESVSSNIVLLILCIVLSALFSASETALISLSKTKILGFIKNDPSKAKAWKSFLDDPQKVLVAILIGNNLVNITASALATSLSLNLFPNIGIGLAVGLMTFVILMFGEITPKGIALRYADGISKRVIYLMYLLSLIFYPVALIFSKIVDLLGGPKKRFLFPLITREELELLLSKKEEVDLEEEERKMIRSVINLEDKVVREIMVPRLDMVCLETSTSVKDAVKVISEYGHSRIPVYENNIDNIVGILYAKDLIPLMASAKWDEKVGNILRVPYFVPETKSVKELFEELRQKRIHIAIVVDEYGGTAGLVTMEDILEEIVGEIEDEYDRELPSVEKVRDDAYIVDGRMNLDELLELFGMEPDMEIDEREYDTVAGLLFSLFGRIPKSGEEVSFKGLKLKVIDVKKNRIRKVMISKEEEKNEET
ncbi:MAG: hemolysin family protein [Synergistetes bacterium]|nr:hemolysin family protein [Synergistota bacterium]MCX8127303.1 hemolysin family protein [Synergistota bacterium]MDW8191810.1 hemolysin family protein [Synergistota bacterium]